jgi:hypothetical protein
MCTDGVFLPHLNDDEIIKVIILNADQLRVMLARTGLRHTSTIAWLDRGLEQRNHLGGFRFLMWSRAMSLELRPWWNRVYRICEGLRVAMIPPHRS